MYGSLYNTQNTIDSLIHMLFVSHISLCYLIMLADGANPSFHAKLEFQRPLVLSILLINDHSHTIR